MYRTTCILGVLGVLELASSAPEGISHVLFKAVYVLCRSFSRFTSIPLPFTSIYFHSFHSHSLHSASPRTNLRALVLASWPIVVSSHVCFYTRSQHNNTNTNTMSSTILPIRQAHIGPKGLDNNGGQPPRDNNGGQPPRGHYVERSRKSDYLKAMHCAGIGAQHTLCLHCGEIAPAAHRSAWRECRDRCPFSDCGTKHIGVLCPLLLRQANSDWCFARAREQMDGEREAVRNPEHVRRNQQWRQEQRQTRPPQNGPPRNSGRSSRGHNSSQMPGGAHHNDYRERSPARNDGYRNTDYRQRGPSKISLPASNTGGRRQDSRGEFQVSYTESVAVADARLRAMRAVQQPQAQQPVAQVTSNELMMQLLAENRELTRRMLDMQAEVAQSRDLARRMLDMQAELANLSQHRAAQQPLPAQGPNVPASGDMSRQEVVIVTPSHFLNVRPEPADERSIADWPARQQVKVETLDAAELAENWQDVDKPFIGGLPTEHGHT